MNTKNITILVAAFMLSGCATVLGPQFSTDPVAQACVQEATVRVAKTPDYTCHMEGYGTYQHQVCRAGSSYRNAFSRETYERCMERKGENK